MSARQRPSALNVRGSDPPRGDAPRTRGAVAVLALEPVHMPAPASRVAVVEDSLQVLAMWAVRAARAASETA